MIENEQDSGGFYYYFWRMASDMKRTSSVPEALLEKAFYAYITISRPDQVMGWDF